MDYLLQHIESLIFSSAKPIKFSEIKLALETAFEAEIIREEIERSILALIEKYKDESYSFEIVEIAEGYQFLSKPAYFQTIGEYIKQEANTKLSRSALETLAIIAYKQPVAKSEIEKIRGVACDYTVQKLLEKELLEILGRDDGPGRPLIYGTSKKFMDYFGISGVQDLPQLKDFSNSDDQIGAPIDITEDSSRSIPKIYISDSEGEESDLDGLAADTSIQPSPSE